METYRYKIVRMYLQGRRRTIRRGLTFDQAQAHCCDPETSASTCRKAVNKRRTAMHGLWFDGFEREAGKGGCWITSSHLKKPDAFSCWSMAVDDALARANKLEGNRWPS